MPRKEKANTRNAPGRGVKKAAQTPAADAVGRDAGERTAVDTIEMIKRRTASRKIRDCVQIKHRWGRT